MAKATYHNEILEGKEFDILAENEDGTVDIGTGKTLVVKSVPVSEDGPKVGHVTIADKQESEKVKSKKSKKQAAPESTESAPAGGPSEGKE